MIEFLGKHFPKCIILMAIRWYLSYSLSYRDIEELMLERNINVDHSTIQRWVVDYSPLLLEEFKKKKKKVSSSWRMDETYIKVKGKWLYLYRAVDKEGKTIDSMLSKKRDKKATKSSGKPKKITIDKSGANKAGIDAINEELSDDKQIEIRQIKYLNNIVEQDHRFIKKITKPMKGFKSFESASATLDGTELCHMIKKGQLNDGQNKNNFEQFYALVG